MRDIQLKTLSRLRAMCISSTFSRNLLITSIIFFILTTLIIYIKIKRKRLPCLGPRLPFGSLTTFSRSKENLGVFIQNVHQKMKNNSWKLGKIYFLVRPMYFITDLDLIKNVLKEDFQYFVDRGTYYNEKDDPISYNLFNVGGSKWKTLRSKLTSTFTPTKIKTMFLTLTECEEHLKQKIEAEISKAEPVDIKEVMACFTTDVIGSCVFGLDLKTFEHDDSPFRVYGKKFFSITRWQALRVLFCTMFPDFARSLRIRLVTKDIGDFFLKLVKNIVVHRDTNNYTRKDFIQLLLELKEKGQRVLSVEEMTAQCFAFFSAGFETSSSTIAFALYELAKEQSLQQKLREEINSVLTKHGGKTTYESITEMKYLNQVIDETLRKYPPLPFLTRKCVKDYKVPDEDVVIKKGSVVLVSILGIHYDREYYPNPMDFDPDRFSEENKSSRHNFAHIPFGEGPRKCIGLRFGLVQSKVGLVSMLKDYQFKVNSKTKEPLRFERHPFFLAAEGGIWLDVCQIEKIKTDN